MELTNFFKAIKSRWDSVSGATVRGLAKGGLWPGQAPHDNTTGPVVIYNVPTDEVTGHLSATIDIIRVQFTIYCDDMDGTVTGFDQCLAIRDALCALFDQQRLTWSGGSACNIRTNAFTPLQDPDGGWLAYVEYKFTITAR